MQGDSFAFCPPYINSSGQTWTSPHGRMRMASRRYPSFINTDRIWMGACVREEGSRPRGLMLTNEQPMRSRISIAFAHLVCHMMPLRARGPLIKHVKRIYPELSTTAVVLFSALVAKRSWHLHRRRCAVLTPPAVECNFLQWLQVVTLTECLGPRQAIWQ